jgi:cyanophycinase
MPQRGGLEWVEGSGWIVLAGGGSIARGELDLITARVLTLANLDRPLVVLHAGGDGEEAEALVDHYTALGGPGGEAFVVSEMSRSQLDDPDFLALLTEAGILHLSGANPRALTRTLHNTQALKRIVLGFATLQGLMIVGSGGGAAALGAWVTPPQQPAEEAPGLNFVRTAIVAPHFTRTEEAEALHRLLHKRPGFIGLGIPDGTALGLGPEGEVETWGVGEVTAVVRR